MSDDRLHRSVILEVIDDIERRAASCRALIKSADPSHQFILTAKASTYEHSAQMIREAIKGRRDD